jgi:hypothetical protein
MVAKVAKVRKTKPKNVKERELKLPVHVQVVRIGDFGGGSPFSASTATS